MYRLRQSDGKGLGMWEETPMGETVVSVWASEKPPSNLHLGSF